MSALTRSHSASRRAERRDRIEAKHRPEVFEQTEEQALATDRALNVLKTSEAYFAASSNFDLCEQVQRGVKS